MKENKVYIIILNYNGSDDSINCIESIQNSIYKNYKIILVDNNSDDDSITKIVNYLNSSNLKYDFLNQSCVDSDENNSDNIIIIKTSKNLGYAFGNNIGIKYALQNDDCDYLWILNNDNIIRENSLLKLIENSNNKTVYGSKVLKYKNPELIDSIGGVLNPYLLTSGHNFSNTLDSKSAKKVDFLDYIHGTSIFFHKDIINSIGYFDETYFMYYEDVEFSLRAKKNGYKLQINQNSVVYHNIDYKKYKNKDLNLLKNVYSVTNRLRLGRKYFKNRIMFVYIGVLLSFFKRIITFRFKEAYLIINYLYKI